MNIKQLRKDIGKENLGKILPILKQNVKDSNAKLADFDNPDKIMFNVMKITIAIGNFGVKLPKKVAGFTKTEENDTQIRGMNTTQQNSYTTYEKIVPIEGYDRKKTREEWIDGMDKYIEIEPILMLWLLLQSRNKVIKTSIWRLNWVNKAYKHKEKYYISRKNRGQEGYISTQYCKIYSQQKEMMCLEKQLKILQ